MTTTAISSKPLLTRKNKIGLVLATLLGLTDIPAVLNQTPNGEEGPPMAVLAVSSICGIVTIVAAVIAWRSGQRAALRVTAGSRILSAILALPAFFVDIPPALAAAAAVFVVVTVVCVVLILTPDHNHALVTD
jgi:hypothetical protein